MPEQPEMDLTQRARTQLYDLHGARASHVVDYLDAKGDTAYYEAKCVEALVQINESMLALQDKSSLGTLENARATLTIVFCDTKALVDWPARRLRTEPHRLVRRLTARLRDRIAIRRVFDPRLESANDPRVVLSVKDTIDWLKAVHCTLGIATPEEKQQARYALRD